MRAHREKQWDASSHDDDDPFDDDARESVAFVASNSFPSVRVVVLIERALDSDSDSIRFDSRGG